MLTTGKHGVLYNEQYNTNITLTSIIKIWDKTVDPDCECDCCRRDLSFTHASPPWSHSRPLPVPASQIPVSQARLRRRQQHHHHDIGNTTSSKGQSRPHTDISKYRPNYTWNRGGRVKELRIRYIPVSSHLLLGIMCVLFQTQLSDSTTQTSFQFQTSTMQEQYWLTESHSQ